MTFDFNQERNLEQQYAGVLAYVEAKGFLKETPYTAAKINGAIKRFMKAEEVTEPKTFTEMEPFVSDLVDFWIDANPDVHTDGEVTLRRAVANYIAFSKVWKTKARTSSILDSDLMGRVGHWITARGALAQMSIVIPSMVKRLNGNQVNLKQLTELLPVVYQRIYITNDAISRGMLELPESRTQEELSKLIGAFCAGQIEHKE